MYIAISILIIIASLLLTFIVLIQNSKGGGLAANFTSGNQTFGVRQTADFLEKATWTLAIVILVLCVAASAFAHNRGKQGNNTVINKIEQTQSTQGQPEFPSALPLQQGEPANPAAAPEE